MLTHILPNTLTPVMVTATLNLGLAILIEATLSFLGVGMPPTEPSLGTLSRLEVKHGKRNAIYPSEPGRRRADVGAGARWAHPGAGRRGPRRRAGGGWRGRRVAAWADRRPRASGQDDVWHALVSQRGGAAANR
ncbi:hypothetical protein G6F40_015586 [Rhizopus arrhizus]|nr:hypothetical protein G6F40_015586 [Rhizopus arrhizus]